jgi:hypothetical protein
VGADVAAIMSGKWIADLKAMTCRNIENGVVVVFEKNGGALQGKIKDIDVVLINKWAGEPHGERRIRVMVEEAEEVFLRAYFEAGNSPGV